MLKIYLLFWKSEPQYTYKRYADEKYVMVLLTFSLICRYVYICLYDGFSIIISFG